MITTSNSAIAKFACAPRAEIAASILGLPVQLSALMR
jgi:hypothetical protein